MADLSEIGEVIKRRRREAGLTQPALAKAAGLSVARIEALENQRLAEIGFQNLTRILHALGLDLRLTELNRQRPTFEDLVAENKKP